MMQFYPFLDALPHISDSRQNQLTDQQMQDVMDALDAADGNHRQWLRKLHSSLICGDPFGDDVTAENAHKCCQFGLWYYNKAPQILAQQNSFIEIEHLHSSMHGSARQLAAMASRGERINSDQYNDFVDRQRVFTEKLMALRDQVCECLYSYDALTGLMTRGPFLKIMDAECARESRTGEHCSLVLMDIDHFKEINDKYGHLAGDRALVIVSRYLRKHMRLYDSVCRYGGEEFLITLPGTDLDQAYSIMERLREELEQLNIMYEVGKFLKITSSFGIASLSGRMGHDTCLKKADQALYQAKLSGRNRVCIAPV
ncbi:MAG TPA: diguanylate cyclase [Gammaproteobacteria bacterium]